MYLETTVLHLMPLLERVDTQFIILLRLSKISSETGCIFNIMGSGHTERRILEFWTQVSNLAWNQAKSLRQIPRKRLKGETATVDAVLGKISTSDISETYELVFAGSVAERKV